MVIHQGNIKAYINFLHQKRTGHIASEALLQKWVGLTSEEIPTQLQHLYQHWDLSFSEASIHEQNFIAFSKPQLNIEKQAESLAQKPNLSQVVKPRKSNIFLIVVLTLLLSLVIGCVIYWMMNRSNSAEATISIKPQLSTTPISQKPANVQVATEPLQANTTNQTMQNPQVLVPKTEAIKPLSSQDERNILSINNLLQAEINQDFEYIAPYYSSDLRQYWDIENPDYESLKNRYENIWSKISQAENKNIHCEKLRKNTYRLLGQFDYYSLKQQAFKSVPVQTIFEFDEEGKIVFTNKEE
jgi:hypothetical protein